MRLLYRLFGRCASMFCTHSCTQKEVERARRSHLGLIVHVPAQNEGISSFVSKTNFMDVAGYGDARRKNDESRVLFRESKLTRMLQDSLRGTSKVLSVSCLNPSFFQNGVYMFSLVSSNVLWFHDENYKFNKKKLRFHKAQVQVTEWKTIFF